MVGNNKLHPKTSTVRTDHTATLITHQWSPSADWFSGRNENETTSHKVETNDGDGMSYIHLKRQTRKAEKHLSVI